MLFNKREYQLAEFFPFALCIGFHEISDDVSALKDFLFVFQKLAVHHAIYFPFPQKINLG